MPVIRRYRVGPLTMEVLYFAELVEGANPNGRLPATGYECHALWHYYCLALQNYNRAKDNLVEESELSLIFNRETAERLFRSVANMHGVEASKMVRFWRIIQRQRLALGGGDQLPREFMFDYWGH